MGCFSIGKLLASRQKLCANRYAFLGVNFFFQVLQKLNICKLGKKLTPAKSRCRVRRFRLEKAAMLSPKACRACNFFARARDLKLSRGYARFFFCNGCFFFFF